MTFLEKKELGCVDDEETIRMCLSCRKKKCTDCLRGSPAAKRTPIPEDTLRACARDGRTMEEIIALTGHTEFQVRRQLRSMGLRLRYRSRLEPEGLRLLNAGMTVQEAARILGVTDETVRVWRRRQKESAD